MKHPAIEQQPEMAAGSEIPWSAKAERDAHRWISRAWFEMWGCLVAALFFAALSFSVHRWWLLLVAAFFFGYGITLLYGLALAREQLGEEMRRGPRGEFYEGSGMLANKPRSMRGLTEWIHWPADSSSFLCECRTLHQWTEAQWIPNYDPAQLDPNYDPALIQDAELFAKDVDPGGGRYVILCLCGRGHFKLKA